MQLDLILYRFERTKTHTLGSLCVIDGYHRPKHNCYILERPWLDNQVNLSCIPAGYYVYEQHKSPRFGECIIIRNVIGRSHILLHCGNKVTDSKGCLLCGETFGYSKDTKTAYVNNSRRAKANFLPLTHPVGRILILDA